MRRSVEGTTLVLKDNNGGALLSITETLSSNKTMLVSLSGKITTEVTAEFEDEMISALTAGLVVIVDFAGVDYICARGLDALLSAQRIVETRKAKFSIRNLTNSVKTIFEDTGFIDLIAIEE
jgi:anti-anti-sigma factor